MNMIIFVPNEKLIQLPLYYFVKITCLRLMSIECLNTRILKTFFCHFILHFAYICLFKKSIVYAFTSLLNRYNIPVCKLYEDFRVKNGLSLHWDIYEQNYITFVQERLQKDYKAFLAIHRKILFCKKVECS